MIDLRFPKNQSCFWRNSATKKTLSPLTRPDPTYLSAGFSKAELHRNIQPMNIKLLDQLFSSLLILLWSYTGLDKVIRFEKNRQALQNQTFPNEIADLLSYSIPAVELGLVALLLFKTTRWWGYMGSLLLLSVFTTYIGLIWVGAFPRVPCSCAGIFETLQWNTHFMINMLFILVTIMGFKSFHLTHYKLE